MARTILVAGTASHVGKSTVAAGLCRLLARRGVSVAPYKAQNMSNNARAVVNPDGGRSGTGPDDGQSRTGPDDGQSRTGPDDGRGEIESDGDPGEIKSDSDWGEIGVSQWVQAKAARVAPTTDHNPVLLKPRGDGESQLILRGEAVGHFSAGSYYDDHWERARTVAREAHERLAAEHEVVIAEGAGSIAEINLHHRDLANVETARFADAEILLVADVERGGVFASVYGTLELLPDDLREQVVGVVVNKFRGDRNLLESGIEELEALTGVPVLGVLPFDDPGLPAEDSVSLPSARESAVWGADDGVPDAEAVTVAVPRLPRVSNFTDLEPLARERGVRVSFRPLDAVLAADAGLGADADFGDADPNANRTADANRAANTDRAADAVVLPGSKNTVDDLLALREAGFSERLESFEGPVVGLCGGYQMLGERITNADVEATGDHEEVAGFGLLPVETRFSPDKHVERVERELTGVGPLAGATGTVMGTVTGYEIHMGETTPTESVERPFGTGGAATDRVLGTYLHGLFENDVARDAFLDTVFEFAGPSRPASGPTSESEFEAESGPETADPYDAAADPYDAAADLLHEHLDLADLFSCI